VHPEQLVTISSNVEFLLFLPLHLFNPLLAPPYPLVSTVDFVRTAVNKEKVSAANLEELFPPPLINIVVPVFPSPSVTGFSSPGNQLRFATIFLLIASFVVFVPILEDPSSADPPEILVPTNIDTLALVVIKHHLCKKEIIFFQ